MRPGRTNRRGATLVETTLILLTFIVMCVGVLDLGQFLYLEQSLVERTRQVARTAVVQNYTPDQVVNAVLYGSAASPAPGASGYLGLSASNVSATISDPATNEKRLVIVVKDLPLRTFSPFLPRQMKSLPVRISIPLETP